MTYPTTKKRTIFSCLLAFFAGCINIPMAIINYLNNQMGSMFISLGFMFICWGIAFYILGNYFDWRNKNGRT